jgi:hypothetical protein
LERFAREHFGKDHEMGDHPMMAILDQLKEVFSDATTFEPREATTWVMQKIGEMSGKDSTDGEGAPQAALDLIRSRLNGADVIDMETFVAALKDALTDAFTDHSGEQGGMPDGFDTSKMNKEMMSKLQPFMDDVKNMLDGK